MDFIIIGSSGRMGKKLQEVISSCQSDRTIALIDHKVSSLNYDDVFDRADVVIDFSLPIATLDYLRLAAKHKTPYVIGTTGFSNDQEDLIKQYATHIAILKSGNMSLGLNLLSILASQAAKILASDDFDIAISESHHRKKIDSPSGSALLLGEAITNVGYNAPVQYNSIRAGTIVGEHTVLFAGNDETIALTHHAQTRDIFAHGALKAARWLKDKAPALYNMKDVLNIKV